ncbi:MAG: biosynthetic arginine decarboxylase [Parahaliea sp.]
MTMRIDSDAAQSWRVSDSEMLYGINAWGAGYYSLNQRGEVQVCLKQDDTTVAVSILDIVKGMRARHIEMPTVLRIRNVLDHRIAALNESFARAIESGGYNNVYRGVFPIKVNQQCHVIEEIADYGRRYHHGFEAGSKAELIIALSQLRDTDSLVVCNGYKDAEFIDLGLYARHMGYPVFFVLENRHELKLIIERAHHLGISPLLGVRMRSATKVDGHWSSDSGDRSIFGLSTTALLQVVAGLREEGMLDCLQMLHCHLGSQVPNIRNVRSGVLEACQFYAGLVEEGAPMGYLDLGGGLAVDYEGASANSTHSMNYQLDEYCVNIVEAVRETLDPLTIAHPVLVSESGRATVAYSSMLLFNILDVRDCKPGAIPVQAPADSSEFIPHLLEVLERVAAANVQECYNDAIFYRDEVRGLFHRGLATLRDRALAEDICMAVMQRINTLLPDLKRVPPELESLPELLSDIYYGNFSLFQSLPDIWAIDQLFPIMPIHRLDEFPAHEGILADLTCDCDGRIDNFTLPDGRSRILPLHAFQEGEDYYLGVFLVGAYQETLGDLHNLFGDTNVVNVTVNADGSFDFAREFHGDSIADVLSYVEYEPKHMQEQFRQVAEDAVRSGKISVSERQIILQAFRDSLSGYTYFEHH